MEEESGGDPLIVQRNQTPDVSDIDQSVSRGRWGKTCSTNQTPETPPGSEGESDAAVG